MKQKRYICIFLLLAVLFGAAGCSSSQETKFPQEPVESEKGSSYKYYYTQLDNTEKNAYNAILEQIEMFPERIEVPVLTKEQLDEVYTALIYDDPQMFFLGSDCTIRQSKKRAYFYPNYTMNAEDYSAMLRKCTVVAADILEEAATEKTNFARERLVHDRLIANCKYNDSKTNSYRGTIYGVLCGGSATCEGYAKTAKYILDMLNIPCYVVSGTSTPPGTQSAAHMWNIVQIDGDFYHLDLTWDDPVMENGSNMIRYFYFNVTDSQIGKTHSDFETVNACTATKCSYYVHERLLFEDFGAAEKERTVEVAARVIDAGSDGFCLRFATEKAYGAAQEKLLTQEGIYDILSKVQELTDRTFATDRVSYVCTDENNSIEFILAQ